MSLEMKTFIRPPLDLVTWPHRSPAGRSTFRLVTLSPPRKPAGRTNVQVRGLLTARGPFRMVRVGPRRPNGSLEGTDRANAVRQLGAPAGMGGKRNCLCLWDTWEPPKPRYRAGPQQIVRLPGTAHVSRA
jgi:hypothetical protein